MRRILHCLAALALFVFANAAHPLAAGLAASPLLEHVIGDAHAQAAPLQPMMIDLAALKHADLPKSGPEMNSKGLVVTDAGTLIIIPKGTAHGGTLVTNGPVKAIAIKLPPQPKDDTVFLN